MGNVQFNAIEFQGLGQCTVAAFSIPTIAIALPEALARLPRAVRSSASEAFPARNTNYM